MCAKCCAFVIFVIYSDICRMIGFPDGHFKIQGDVQVSCRYQFHMNPYNRKVYVYQFWSTCCRKYILKYAMQMRECVHACIRACVRARVCVKRPIFQN